MNVEEQRLADWLHEVTPEPPQAVTAEQVVDRVAARQRATLWLPSVAAAVAVMLVAALAFGLSRIHHAASPANPATHGSTSSAPSTSPSPSRGTQRPVTLPVHTWQARRVGGAALEPDSTAVLEGRLYALTRQNTRTGTSHLVRLDPRTGEVLARSAQVVSWRVRPVLADGLVWTVAAGGKTVLGFDPTTLAESTRVSVSLNGSADQGVALSLGGPLSAVLFGAGRTVAFVDPGRVLRAFTVDAPISGVALNPRESRLYVAVAEGAGGRLETRDPRTGAQVSAPIATGLLLGLLPTAGGLWDTVAGGHEAQIQFRPANNLSAATSPRAGGSGGGQDIMPADNSGVAWLGGAGEIGCADAETGAMRATAPVGTGPHDSRLGYIGGMTALDHKLYAAFTDLQDKTVLIKMTPPATCFRNS